MEVEAFKNKKEQVKGGGVCIYCGWDGGEDSLRSEHIVPYSLAGNVELLGASCRRCEKITSYLDGYLANAIYGHFRVHVDLQSRSGHPPILSATVQREDRETDIEFAPKDHPYFLNMPIWQPPGVMRGAQMSEEFGSIDKHVYWYLPDNIRETIGLGDGEIARIVDKSREPNIATFSRALAKIAYCDAVRRHGLDGFRPLATPDIILGKYKNIAYFIGSERRVPLPPYPRGFPHSVTSGTMTYGRLKLLTSTIRLFGDSGTKEHGMPFYIVVYGAEGHHKVTPKRPLPELPRQILL